MHDWSGSRQQQHSSKSSLDEGLRIALEEAEALEAQGHRTEGNVKDRQAQDEALEVEAAESIISATSLVIASVISFSI